MTKEEIEKDVRTYLRQQFGLNGGGMVSCDLKKLLLGFAEPREKQLREQIKEMKEVISELIAITDEDICKECDGGIHCSECYVNHAQTYASHFINEKEIEK